MKKHRKILQFVLALGVGLSSAGAELTPAMTVAEPIPAPTPVAETAPEYFTDATIVEPAREPVTTGRLTFNITVIENGLPVANKELIALAETKSGRPLFVVLDRQSTDAKGKVTLHANATKIYPDVLHVYFKPIDKSGSGHVYTPWPHTTYDVLYDLSANNGSGATYFSPKPPPLPPSVELMLPK